MSLSRLVEEALTAHVGRAGGIGVRAIHFVPDVSEALRFYGALGLQPGSAARTGVWAELAGATGELALHDAARAADGEGRSGTLVTFVSHEPLERVRDRLTAAGFAPEGEIVDQEWGRSLYVRGPDGEPIQIDDQDPSLYT